MLLVISSIQSKAQEFSFSDFIEQVKSNHPIARQALLQNEFGQANQRMAKGGFDPKVEAFHDHKSFDSKNYFRTTNAALKIPTWFGVELKAGYERADGQFLDNSEFLPDRGLWNFGISVPLGKGLVIDERRAALKQAEIFLQATNQERRIISNELLYKAGISYLNWQQAQQSVEIAKQGLELANNRMQITVSSFENGDLPAIDTLESYIAIQSREQDLFNAERALANARIQMETFLWSEGYIPLELNQTAVPEKLDPSIILEETNRIILMQEQNLNDHPEILATLFKRAELEVENQLNKEATKPDLRINYSPLIPTTPDQLFGPFTIDNYKLSASFQYPILARKERGNIAMTKLKIQETNLTLEDKRRSILAKLDGYRTNIQILQEQVPLAESNVFNYNQMLLAERRKFGIGESSIFLLNNREVKFLESQLKFLETQVKLIKNQLTYLFFSGKIGDVL